jgi:protein-L-isoaspartate(D-aspartate) O-methyltransferase
MVSFCRTAVLGARRGYNEVVASNEELVEALVAAGIRDPRVRDAFRGIRREEFVSQESRNRAYEDVPLPIPHGQVTTQPSLIARMIEALALQGSERVLEIGTGLGFQTALLAVLGGEVWSVERWADVARRARANLARAGIDNAHVVVGDGSRGLPGHRPFQAIVVSAAFTNVPAPLAAQLSGGGRLVQPIGPGGRERVTLFAEDAGRLRREAALTGAHFVRLVGAHGFEKE